MPSRPAGRIAPGGGGTAGPQAPPRAGPGGEPSPFLGPVPAAAVRRTLHPVPVGLPETPNPGSDGITTSKESSTSPPYATGSVSGPTSFRNSTTDPGQPCVRRRGSAPGFVDLTW